VKVLFDKSFSKSLDKMTSIAVKKKIEAVILHVENAPSLYEIQNIKKMEGYKSFYRIRIGEYRIGMEMIDKNSVLFIIVAHRKDIYRIFP